MKIGLIQKLELYHFFCEVPTVLSKNIKRLEVGSAEILAYFSWGFNKILWFLIITLFLLLFLFIRTAMSNRGEEQRKLLKNFVAHAEFMEEEQKEKEDNVIAYWSHN